MRDMSGLVLAWAWHEPASFWREDTMSCLLFPVACRECCLPASFNFCTFFIVDKELVRNDIPSISKPISTLLCLFIPGGGWGGESNFHCLQSPSIKIFVLFFLGLWQEWWYSHITKTPLNSERKAMKIIYISELHHVYSRNVVFKFPRRWISVMHE